MPYVVDTQRQEVDGKIDELIDKMRCIVFQSNYHPEEERNVTTGIANYVATRIVLGSLKPKSGWSYETLSNAIKTLRCAADEIERRLMGPYEDGAIKRNGDIPELQL